MFEVLEVSDDHLLGCAEVQLALAGEIDILSTRQLPERLLAALPRPSTLVVVDASRVTFIDVYAIRLLLVLRARLRAEGHDLVLGPRSAAVSWVLQVLELAGELGGGVRRAAPASG